MKSKIYMLLASIGLLALMAGGVLAQEPSAGGDQSAPSVEKAKPSKAHKVSRHRDTGSFDWAKYPSIRKRSKAFMQSDGHLSANTNPAFPADADVYTVAKGDTLSKIAGELLKSTMLWPQIWEKNQHVKNPHWIWPLDKLLVGAVKLVDNAPPTPAMDQGPACEKKTPFSEPLALLKAQQIEEEKAQELRLSVQQVETFYGTDRELYGTGLIYDSCPKFSDFITGSEIESFTRNLSLGNIVYINRGTAKGVKNGDRFLVIRSAGEIKHPDRHYKVGYYFRQMGTLKVVIAREKHSVAVVDWSARPMFVGDAIIPFEKVDKVNKKTDKNNKEFTPLSEDLLGDLKDAKKYERFSTDNDKAKGYIVFIEDNLPIAGIGNVVYIDLGKSKSLSLGDHLNIYVKADKFKNWNEYYPDFGSRRFKERVAKRFSEESKEEVQDRHVPRIVTGELVIIDVFEKTAKAVVVNSTVPVALGSHVQLQ